MARVLRLLHTEAVADSPDPHERNPMKTQNTDKDAVNTPADEGLRTTMIGPLHNQII